MKAPTAAPLLLLLLAACAPEPGDGTPPVDPPAEDASVGAADPSFAAQLYLLPQRKFTVPKVGDAIDAALAAHPGVGTLLFYVHGRACGGGGEPQKSLGGAVPELEQDYQPAGLFDSTVLSSAATALAGHAQWLGRLDFASRVFVTVNDGDNVLLGAGLGRGTRLGKQLGSEPLTPRAAYVDFTAAGVNHAYYLKSGQKGAHMPQFYSTVLHGQPYDFAASKAITRTVDRSGAKIYYFDGK